MLISRSLSTVLRARISRRASDRFKGLRYRYFVTRSGREGPPLTRNAVLPLAPGDRSFLRDGQGPPALDAAMTSHPPAYIRIVRSIPGYASTLLRLFLEGASSFLHVQFESRSPHDGHVLLRSRIVRHACAPMEVFREVVTRILCEERGIIWELRL